MDLSHEDKLRLNVLLAQSLQAVRIDESRMEVHALSDKGEAKISLHASCKDEKYIKLVKQWLSTNILGSPGGYPIFLRRWTRMGQARDNSLEKLLLLGESEAVVAVVSASGLTNEIARRAWWCAPTAENARCMLANKAVANDSMGPELAKFLVEFLPFEESSRAMMRSVRLVLQPGLIDDDVKLAIWKRGGRRNTFYIGFIQQCPNELPIAVPAHEQYSICVSIGTNNGSSSGIFTKLQSVLSERGQAVIAILDTVLNKPNDQDVAVEAFNTLREYFHIDENYPANWRDIDDLADYVENLMQTPDGEIREVLTAWPDAKLQVHAILFLSMVSETLLDPVFGVTDSIGSVMRKRIAHLTGPILNQLSALK